MQLPQPCRTGAWLLPGTGKEPRKSQEGMAPWIRTNPVVHSGFDCSKTPPSELFSPKTLPLPCRLSPRALGRASMAAIMPLITFSFQGFQLRAVKLKGAFHDLHTKSPLGLSSEGRGRIFSSLLSLSLSKTSSPTISRFCLILTLLYSPLKFILYKPFCQAPLWIFASCLMPQ